MATRLRDLAKEIVSLGSKSAILADSKSSLFCSEYLRLNLQNTSSEFLSVLVQELGIQTDRLFDSIHTTARLNNTPQEFKQNLKPATYEKLSTSLQPQYYELFKNLARVNNGVFTLVKIRQDLLDVLEKTNKTQPANQTQDQLKIMNSVLKNLLGLWFSTGLLNIQRIDWNSPASLVEKVAHYESVHRIRALNDLKTRLSPSRRCFVYTHSTIPYEPLVILHIALTDSISSSIDALVRNYNRNSKEETLETDFDPNKCTNAIFYSITSCQKGLQQVELGNSLIKSCVRLLIHELPNLSNFHTLSPIPKFREWLDLKLKFAQTNDPTELKLVQSWLSNEGHSLEMVKSHINSKGFRDRIANGSMDNQLDQTVAKFLTRSCAYYLYAVKKNGFAFNSVCNFHIKNGAQIYRINFGADLSDHGWDSSYSMMVNYGYYLNELDDNCVGYLTNKNIKISDHVRALLVNN